LKTNLHIIMYITYHNAPHGGFILRTRKRRRMDPSPPAIPAITKGLVVTLLVVTMNVILEVGTNYM